MHWFCSLLDKAADLSQRYMNFAIGDEKPEEIYGDEKRLARLRALKAKWDPEGYFNCYNPFV